MATTTKSKVQGKQTRNPESGNALNLKKETAKTNKPTEDQIRRKAQELYYQRLNRGEYGTELEDWQKAEKLLTEG